MADIRLAQSSWDLIDTLKRVWDMRVNYVPIRIAIGRSLLSGDLPKLGDYPSDGRSIDTQQILSAGETDYAPLFRALIVQRHGQVLNDLELLSFLKVHIDHGLQLIREDCATFKSSDDYVDYLIDLTQKGLEQRTLKAPSQLEPSPAFTGALTIRLGEDVVSGQQSFLKYDQCLTGHIAFIGEQGTGKTGSVKEILYQMRQQSNYGVNFIFFDYDGDVASDKQFIEATRSRVIQLHTETLPINPFIRVKVTSESATKLAAQEAANIFHAFERNIGTVQGKILHNSIQSALTKRRYRVSPFPDWYSVREEIEIAYSKIHRKPDTLLDIIRQMTDSMIFAHADAEDQWQSLSDKTVIIDLHKLTAPQDLVVAILLDTVYRELSIMPDVEYANEIRPTRTIIVIDQAHSFLRDKKRTALVSRIAKEISIKGGSLFLLSQSSSEYDQNGSKISDLLEFVLAFRSSTYSTKFIQRVLGINGQQARDAMKEISTLPTAHAITRPSGVLNSEDLIQIKLNQFDESLEIYTSERDIASTTA